jgi:hypothetical protein
MMRVLREGRALERVARVVVCVGWVLRMIGILGGSCWLIEIEMLLKLLLVWIIAAGFEVLWIV